MTELKWKMYLQICTDVTSLSMIAVRGRTGTETEPAAPLPCFPRTCDKLRITALFAGRADKLIN